MAKWLVYAKEFFFDQNYQVAFRDAQHGPAIGFVIAGYSPGERQAEEYEIQIVAPGICQGPRSLRREKDSGLNWYGETEPITRLILGYSGTMAAVLVRDLGIPEDQIEPIMMLFQQKFALPVISPAMPIQDAIDLATFLVDVAVNYARFKPGAPTVGGPIEVAAITKHEGFKWIQRKHYYRQELNPAGGGT